MFLTKSKKKYLGAIWLLALTLTLPQITPAFAARGTTSKLNALNQKISALQNSVASSSREEALRQKELKKAEIALGSSSIKLQKTEKKLDAQKKILLTLNAKQHLLENELTNQKTYLSNETRATYLSSTQKDYLKMLLNAEDPSSVSRMFNYYRYIGASRIDVMQGLSNTLIALQQNSSAITTQTKTLQNIYSLQNKEKQKLETIKNKRNKVLMAINANLKSESAKLNQMLAERAALERVLSRFSGKSTRTTAIHGNVANLQGKLLMPTAGKISSHYGNKETSATLQWNGILISAPEGQEVHAIYGGKVVFANWLAGYGLLIIIDHGDGYLSIYGRNHALLKKVGDKVVSGDTIATVGKSGGYDQPALYFAMRYNGRPIDPTGEEGK